MVQIYNPLDDSPFLLRDGSRSVTGNLTFDVGPTIANSGTFLCSALAVFANTIQQVSLAPLLQMFNTNSSNADAARASKVQHGGQKADASQHWLAETLIDHDGAGNDEKGRWTLRVNRSTTGLGNPDDAVIVDSTDMRVLSELRAHTTRRTHRYNSAETTINAAFTDIPFAVNDRTDTGFTWDGSGIECTVGFDGEVEIEYDITGFNDSGGNDRSEGHFRISTDTGGGYGALAGSYAGTYHRANAGEIGWDSCSCKRRVSVSNGDKFKIQGQNVWGGTLKTVSGGCRVTLRRVAAALP